MRRAALVLTTILGIALPSSAYAATGEVPEVLALGAGVVALAAAAALLVGMLSLARIAEGAAIAENIRYAVLAVMCLSASVLMAWVGRWVPDLSVEHARLGADLLSVVAMVLFSVYFFRVRLAMSHFLKRLSGEEQLLTAVVDPNAADGE